jgi:hypothetical protein
VSRRIQNGIAWCLVGAAIVAPSVVTAAVPFTHDNRWAWLISFVGSSTVSAAVMIGALLWLATNRDGRS